MQVQSLLTIGVMMFSMTASVAAMIDIICLSSPNMFCLCCANYMYILKRFCTSCHLIESCYLKRNDALSRNKVKKLLSFVCYFKSIRSLATEKLNLESNWIDSSSVPSIQSIIAYQLLHHNIHPSAATTIETKEEITSGLFYLFYPLHHNTLTLETNR